MSKITEAIAKSIRSGATDPTRFQKKVVHSGGHRGSKKARPTPPVVPVHIDTDREILYANRVITSESKSEVVAPYKMLRTRLLHVMRSNQWQVIAVTSPLAGDGKTLTATNLAIVLAREGSQNVFLVDLDLRSPSINHYLGVDREESSITRFYKEDQDLSGLLITFEQNGLFVIGNNGPGIENSSELISSERSEKLLAELKSMDPNGIFLFDLPPVLPTDDVLAFAPLLDAALVVVSEGRTRRDNIVKSFDLLNGASIEVAGVVLNMAGEGNVDAYY